MAKLCFLSVQNFALSHNSLQLEAAVLEAVFEALQARQQHSDNGQTLTTQSPAQAIRNVYRNGNGSLRTGSSQASFETLFRAATVRQPAVCAPVND